MCARNPAEVGVSVLFNNKYLYAADRRRTAEETDKIL